MTGTGPYDHLDTPAEYAARWGDADRRAWDKREDYDPAQEEPGYGLAHLNRSGRTFQEQWAA